MCGIIEHHNPAYKKSIMGKPLKGNDDGTGLYNPASSPNPLAAVIKAEIPTRLPQRQHSASATPSIGNTLSSPFRPGLASASLVRNPPSTLPRPPPPGGTPRRNPPSTLTRSEVTGSFGTFTMTLIIIAVLLELLAIRGTAFTTPVLWRSPVLMRWRGAVGLEVLRWAICAAVVLALFLAGKFTFDFFSQQKRARPTAGTADLDRHFLRPSCTSSVARDRSREGHPAMRSNPRPVDRRRCCRCVAVGYFHRRPVWAYMGRQNCL